MTASYVFNPVVATGLGRDLAVALIEDAVAIGGAARILWSVS